MQKYRFTKPTSERLRELLQSLGEVEPGLELLKNGNLIIYGQDSEGNKNEGGLAPCLRKLADRTPTPLEKFDRRSLSPLINYDSTYKGRELSYLVNLLTTINILIRNTIEKDKPYFGPKLERKGVIEFDFPESREDDHFSEWFEPATAPNYPPDYSKSNQLGASNSDRSRRVLKISNLLLQVDYSEQVYACDNIIRMLSPGFGIICTASDEIIHVWMIKRIFESLGMKNFTIKNAKIYPIKAQSSPIRANHEYFWEDFARSLELRISPQEQSESNFVEAVLNAVCEHLQNKGSVIVVVYGMDNLTPDCQKFLLNDVFRQICHRLEQQAEAKRGRFSQNLMPRFVLLVSDSDSQKRAYSFTDSQFIQTSDIPVALKPLAEINPENDVAAWLRDGEVKKIIEQLGFDHKKVCDDLGHEYRWVKTDPTYVLKELCSVFGPEHSIWSFEEYWRLAG